jgi:hypothetical protein
MPGYIPCYCIECLFFKELGEGAGRCLVWRNNRSPYARIYRKFVEYKHFDAFTGKLLETNKIKQEV